MVFKTQYKSSAFRQPCVLMNITGIHWDIQVAQIPRVCYINGMLPYCVALHSACDAMILWTFTSGQEISRKHHLNSLMS